MPGPCMVKGCDDWGYVRSKRGKFCFAHHVESLRAEIAARGWEGVQLRSAWDGSLTEAQAADRQRRIEISLDEPWASHAINYHQLIVEALA